MSMDGYRRRVVDNEIDELMQGLPALVLEGPRGVGKTATALERATTIHALDDPGQRSIIAADPTRLTRGEPPILIDEWQRTPESWDLVRRAVDSGAPAGTFLLTGSAVPADLPTHSGAGRMVTIRMRPLSIAERNLEQPTVSLSALLSGTRPVISGRTTVDLEAYASEIVTSGLPGIRHLSGRALRSQLDGYLSRITERDFEELGHRVRNPVALRHWMVAYAAASSTTASYETIRNAATSDRGNKPAKTTTQPYRDVLERLWVVEPVPAWLPTRNHIARLASPPKHQLADPALAARLLGVDEHGLLTATEAGPPMPRNDTLLGTLFESLITLSVRVYSQHSEARVHHLRTHRGEHEVDLIIERADGRVLALEVKLSRNVDNHDVRHLNWLSTKIGDELLDAAIITTGTEAYRRADGVAVIPAALLGP